MLGALAGLLPRISTARMVPVNAAACALGTILHSHGCVNEYPSPSPWAAASRQS